MWWPLSIRKPNPKAYPGLQEQRRQHPMRNLPMGFRELRRQHGLDKANYKLAALLKIGWWDPEVPALIRDGKLTPDEIERLRDLQSFLIKNVNRIMKTLHSSADGINALSSIIIAAQSIGRLRGADPIKRRLGASNAGKGNAAWWHEISVSRAAELRKKYPNKTKPHTDRWIASRVFAELKDKPDRPQSVGTVDTYLRRNLWTNGVRPTR